MEPRRPLLSGILGYCSSSIAEDTVSLSYCLSAYFPYSGLEECFQCFQNGRINSGQFFFKSLLATKDWFPFVLLVALFLQMLNSLNPKLSNLSPSIGFQQSPSISNYLERKIFYVVFHKTNI